MSRHSSAVGGQGYTNCTHVYQKPQPQKCSFSSFLGTIKICCIPDLGINVCHCFPVKNFLFSLLGEEKKNKSHRQEPQGGPQGSKGFDVGQAGSKRVKRTPQGT